MFARAFTLIELLMVILILGIMMGLVFVGLGNTLEWAKVNRSSYVVIAAFDEARQASAARGLNHTIVFNSVNDPRKPGEIARVGSDRDPDEADYTIDLTKENGSGSYANQYYPSYVAFRARVNDPKYLPWLANLELGNPAPNDFNSTPPVSTEPGLPHGAHTQRYFSPLTSKKPEDQWLAVYGPWRDYKGDWQQVSGGMPHSGGGSQSLVPDSSGVLRRPADRDNPLVPVQAGGGGFSKGGGIFGHPLDADGGIASDRCTSVLKVNEAVWDPYQVMLGSQRRLEKGTRWGGWPDVPEWKPVFSQALAFRVIAAPALTANRGITSVELFGPASGWWVDPGPHITSFTTHFNGNMSTNRVSPENPTSSFPTSGGQINYDVPAMYAYAVIVSQKTKATSHTAVYDNGASSLSWDYDRPVAINYITILPKGELVIAQQPVYRP